MSKHQNTALAALACAASLSLAAVAQDAKKPAASPTSPAAPKSDVVGRVNGKPITWEQLIARMRRDNPSAFRKAVGDSLGPALADSLFGAGAKPQIAYTQTSALAALRKNPTPAIVNYLNTMLQEQAILGAAEEQKALPNEAQINAFTDNYLKRVRQQQNVPAQVTDAQFLAKLGIDKSVVKNQARPYLAALNLVAKELEKTLGHPLGSNDYLQARHILVTFPQAAPDAKPEEKEKAKTETRAKVTSIAEDIKAGKKTFEEAAAEFGSDGTKTTGGDLGPFVRGVMVKEFETAAFALKPGELSTPVETQFGYHLIRVDKTGKDLSEEQKFTALERYAQSRFQTLVTGLQQKANAVNELVKSLPTNGPAGFPGGQ